MTPELKIIPTAIGVQMATTGHGEVECYFCGAKVASVEAAIESGWQPGWYEFDACDEVIEGREENEIDEPVCPCCQKKHLRTDEHGDLFRWTPVD